MIQHECAIALSIGVSIAAFLITNTIASTVLKARFIDVVRSSLEQLDAMNGQSEISLEVERCSARGEIFLQCPVGSRASTAGLAAVTLQVPLRFCIPVIREFGCSAEHSDSFFAGEVIAVG
jgi:hypothetical protein